MRTDDFEYTLPPELIAQAPAEPRDASRLLVLNREHGALEHRVFREIGAFLSPGDRLVVNETRVLRARLRGTLPGGGAAEALLLRQLDAEHWEALVRPGRRLQPGRTVRFGPELTALVESATEDGTRVLRFPPGSDPESAGETPLPPYIQAGLTDAERYQTVYSRVPGSAAAPTAGLHFTPELLAALHSQGVERTSITLHIGPGTFRPVSVEDPRQHPIHAEWYEISAAAAAEITATRAAGGRIVAVGTTVVRTLEQAALDTGGGPLGAVSGWTRLLILPGHRFGLVDALVTNFHLPRSSLLMLVSALAGHERVLAAYREAVDQRYRFYSFGDAMLVV